MLRDVYSFLAETLIHLRDHAEAARIAEHLSPIPLPKNWSGHLSAGWFLARCAALAEKDNALSSEQRQELAAGYADRAVSHLRRALQRGYNDFDYLKTDEELAIVRGRKDFQELLAVRLEPSEK